MNSHSKNIDCFNDNVIIRLESRQANERGIRKGIVVAKPPLAQSYAYGDIVYFEPGEATCLEDDLFYIPQKAIIARRRKLTNEAESVNS